MCCRGSDHPGSGINGTIVLGNSADPNGDITRSSHTQQIPLNRKRTNFLSSTCVYIREVLDGSYTTMTKITT